MVHLATVEQVTDEDGDDAYRAVCLETGAVCDAWAFVSEAGIPLTWAHILGVPRTEGDVIAAALEYLGDPGLHEPESPHGCRFAAHVVDNRRHP